MTFFMIAMQMATIFISAQYPLTLKFDHQIEFVNTGAGAKGLTVYKSKNGNILVLKALTTKIDTNLVVVTDKKLYNFYLKYDPIKSHKLIAIKDGEKDSRYFVVKKSKSYKILEGDSSCYVLNNLKTPVYINGQKTRKKLFVTKGAPVFVNGQRVMN